MEQFEYKVVPAPTKGRKARGVRKPEAKFALSVEEIMNEMAVDGWQYQRSETLPHEERSGLTNTQTTFRSILVFRRTLPSEDTAPIEDTVPIEDTNLIEEPAVSTEKPEQIQAQIIPETPPALDIPDAPTKVIPTRVQRVAQGDEFEDEDRLYSQDKPLAPTPGRGSLPSALRRRADQMRAQKDIAAE